MSYKILDCTRGVSEAISDGVVKGVFDECSVFTDAKRVIIAKGLMVLSGVDVLFDGREIIPIPDGYGDGRYYIVGVMKVEGGKPYSFYLSLRDGLNLSRSGLEDESGVVEHLIAEVGVSAGKVWAQRVLPVIGAKKYSKSELDFFRKKFKEGTKLSISDAINGEFSKFSIFGMSGPGLAGVGDFRLVSRTANILDIDSIDIRDIGFDDGEGYYVVPENIWGAVEWSDKGFTVHGRDGLDCEDERGVLKIHYGTLESRDYCFSFKACAEYMYSFMDEEKNVSVEVYTDGVKIARVDGELFGSTGVTKKISVPFTVSAATSVVEFKIFLHGHKLILSEFCLSEGATADYVEYGMDERAVEIRDRKGNSYKLFNTGFARDEITFDRGECVLIKRVARGRSDLVRARPFSNCVGIDGMINIANYDGEIWGNVVDVLYELKEYERIPLSDECANALTGIRTYRGTTVVDSIGSEIKPFFKAYYKEDVYSD